MGKNEPMTRESKVHRPLFKAISVSKSLNELWYASSFRFLSFWFETEKLLPNLPRRAPFSFLACHIGNVPDSLSESTAIVWFKFNTIKFSKSNFVKRKNQLSGVLHRKKLWLLWIGQAKLLLRIEAPGLTKAAFSIFLIKLFRFLFLFLDRSFMLSFALSKG